MQKEDVPGKTGTLRQRLEQVVDNEMPWSYAEITKHRIAGVLDDWEAGALERAKAATRKMLGGLMPGNTGTMMADEVAMKALAAALASNEGVR